MLFSRTYSLSGLVTWCRSLQQGIGVGLPLPRIFTQLATRGPSGMRSTAERIRVRLEQGDSLETALRSEAPGFPDLFVDLAGVGEQTGHLPEVFHELEQYYELQLKMRRQFRAGIIWPMFQFTAAIFVIGFLIWILGFIGEMTNSPPLDPTGLGLTGTTGALIWFGSVAGILFGGFLLFRFLSNNVRHLAVVEGMLLRLPGIGPYLDAVVMQRFCLCLGLTMESGLPVKQAIRKSLRASGNSAFIRAEDVALKQLKKGTDLTDALSACGVFTEDFIHTLAVAEESGQIPEVMTRQSGNYREEASRRLTTLTWIASFGVWLIVAIFIIIAIFQIASIYFNALESF